ncbi:MAG TPA: serine/threonine-protein kinase, partial [Acidimicrobiales bacterium]|nr:serine/threonine-protein kinase [Acidimicrobiales bacterium]
VDRLQWEASAIASLDHPYILKVAELIADEEGLAIAMHLADGGSLGDALSRRGQLPAEEGALLGANVADALCAIHGLGIVHADVKPSNILSDGVGEPWGVPLLSDVGLSRWTATAPPWGGAVGGTAEYLDPTVAAGASPSAASDVYSLGVVCYQILAGRLPYKDATPLATIRAADRGNAEPLAEAVPTVPIGLAAIVERAMSRRPQARPSTVGEVADGLRAEIAGGWHSATRRGRVVPIGDRPAEDSSRATEPRRIRARRGSSHRSPEMPAPSRRSRAPAMTVSVATALVVVATTWAFGHRSGTHHSTDPCRARKSAAPQRTGPTPGVVTVLADVAGDGCLVPVMWSSGMITVPPTSGQAPVRFALGEPADELLLGEWDCRRGARPALYRPATGQVFYFDAWAEPGRDLTPSLDGSTTITHGVPRVVRDGARGCDRVEVARTRGPPP